MTDGADAIARHLRALADVAAATAGELAQPVAGAADAVTRAIAAGGKVMFCGNGGSAADAQHLATEYVVRFARERPALAGLALTTDTSLLTAAANDLGFERVFARQIEALGRPGDVLFLHSTSGESPNLVAAADAARAKGVRTVAMLARGGGALAPRVDLAIIVPTESSAHAQEIHLALGHAICAIVEERCGAAARE
jgi:D-sedoheptulose 7-phosphate isomerase